MKKETEVSERNSAIVEIDKNCGFIRKTSNALLNTLAADPLIGGMFDEGNANAGPHWREAIDGIVAKIEAYAPIDAGNKAELSKILAGIVWDITCAVLFARSGVKRAKAQPAHQAIRQKSRAIDGIISLHAESWRRQAGHSKRLKPGSIANGICAHVNAELEGLGFASMKANSIAKRIKRTDD